MHVFCKSYSHSLGAKSYSHSLGAKVQMPMQGANANAHTLGKIVTRKHNPRRVLIAYMGGGQFLRVRDKAQRIIEKHFSKTGAISSYMRIRMSMTEHKK